MKLLFKEKFLSWFGNYNIFGENDEILYRVKGKMALGRCLKIYDSDDQEVGTVKEKLMTLLPKFEIYIGEEYVGCISKELTFLSPKFQLDYNGWQVQGEPYEFDYEIFDSEGMQVAVITKQFLKLTDTYVIDVKDPENALDVLMLVLAIDADKSRRNE